MSKYNDDPMRKLVRNGKNPEICSKCGKPTKYKGLGEYVCKSCGNSEYSDYGKVRKYLEENGICTYVEVMKATGVSKEVVTDFLEHGRVELPKDSAYVMHCQNCGAELRFGRICLKCGMALKRQGEDVDDTIIGERFREDEPVNRKQAGKMQFLDKKRK